MKQKTSSVWPILRDADLVDGAQPETGELESPWYVKGLLAFSGWLAALFLLGFIGTAFLAVIENSFVALIVGAAMIGGAFHLLRLPKSEFYEHLSLALSLAGQMLMTWAIFDLTDNSGISVTFWLLTALLQTLLAIVMPNFTHRVFSAFIAAVCFALALTEIGAPYVFSGIVMFCVAWLWLNEFRYPQHMRQIQAIGYGLVLAVLVLTGSILYGHDAMNWLVGGTRTAIWFQPWMSDVLIGGVMLYVVWQLLQRHRQTLSRQQQFGILFAALLLAAASVEAPGISVGLIILLLGFAGSNRSLLGLGIVALLFYLSSYYYFLDITLLAKAQSLLIVGLVLLALRTLLLRIMPTDRSTDHA